MLESNDRVELNLTQIQSYRSPRITVNLIESGFMVSPKMLDILFFVFLYIIKNNITNKYNYFISYADIESVGIYKKSTLKTSIKNYALALESGEPLNLIRRSTKHKWFDEEFFDLSLEKKGILIKFKPLFFNVYFRDMSKMATTQFIYINISKFLALKTVHSKLLYLMNIRFRTSGHRKMDYYTDLLYHLNFDSSNIWPSYVLSRIEYYLKEVAEVTGENIYIEQVKKDNIVVIEFKNKARYKGNVITRDIFDEQRLIESKAKAKPKKKPKVKKAEKPDNTNELIDQIDGIIDEKKITTVTAGIDKPNKSDNKKSISEKSKIEKVEKKQKRERTRIQKLEEDVQPIETETLVLDAFDVQNLNI